MKKNTELINLIIEYLKGELDNFQHEELMRWVEVKEENRRFFERICSSSALAEKFRNYQQIDTEMAIRKFDRRIGRTSSLVVFRRYWHYAAVVLLLLCAGTAVYWLQPRSEHLQTVTYSEILPGSAKALLLLADGREIVLGGKDSLFMEVGEGKSITDKHTQLIYGKGVSVEELQYNELKIPRGGEYQVVLSDGSVVRLNSASSLKYPIAFGEEKREVELTGEAYFEVAKGAAPFMVKMGDMSIKVYGTIFNVNGHVKDRIQTALREGKIGISVEGRVEEYVLTPSQVADFNTQTRIVNIAKVDLTAHFAWTKDLFIFNNETLGQIMTTLSLWYDVDVLFQHPALQKLHFTGCIKRYDQVNTILNALSQSVGVKFHQQGKVLTISQ